MTKLTIWPTKDHDMRVANEIMRKYIEINEGQPLSFFEIKVSECELPDVELADWIKEMASYFHDHYGYEQGEFVIKLVLSQYFRHNQTIH